MSKTPTSRRSLALLLVAGTAQAGGGNDLFDMDLDQLGEVVVLTASRTEQSLHDTPGRVLVIPREQIERRGYRHLGELLAEMPGVDVQGYSNSTYFNRISLRGLVGNNKFLILHNGVRINGPAGEPLPIADNFPLYHASRVEIVYAPGSALYGADAMTGIVNIITANGEESPSQLAAEWGENGYRRYNGAARLVAGDWRFTLAGQTQQSENTDFSQEYSSAFPFADLRDFAGNVLVPVDARRGFDNATEARHAFAELRYADALELGYNRHDFVHPTTTGDLPSIVDYGGDWQSQVETHYGRYRFALGDALSGLLQASHSRYELGKRSDFVNIFTNYVSGYHYATSLRKDLEFQLDYRLNEAGTLSLGASWTRERATPKTPDLSHPLIAGQSPEEQGLYYNGTDDSLPVRLFEDVGSTTRGAFLQYQQRWNDHWYGVAGLRHDSNSHYGSRTTPRLAVVHNSDDQGKWTLSYSEAFLAPSPYFVYEHFGSFSGLRDEAGRYVSFFMQVPNLALRPEELRMLELSHERQLGEKLLLTVSLFDSRLSDLILQRRTPEPISDFVPGGFITTTMINDNVGDVRVRGLDLTLRGEVQWLGLPLGYWANYTYLSGELALDGRRDPLPYAARHNLKLGADLELTPNLVLSPSLLAADKTYPLLQPRDDGERNSPGYALLNLQLRVRDILPDTDLRLRIDNVFDRRWYKAADGNSTTFLASAQDRRQFSLSLTHRF